MNCLIHYILEQLGNAKSTMECIDTPDGAGAFVTWEKISLLFNKDDISKMEKWKEENFEDWWPEFSLPTKLTECIEGGVK